MCTHTHTHTHTQITCTYQYACTLTMNNILFQTPNAVIEYGLVTERGSSAARFFDVNRQTGEIMVIQPLFNDPKLQEKYQVVL